MKIDVLTSALMSSQRRFGELAQKVATNGPEVDSVVGVLREETQFKATARTLQVATRMDKHLLDILV